jgi:hypothetical protein
MKRILLLSFALLGCAVYVSAQQLMSVTPRKPVVCYLEAVNKNTVVPPPEAYRRAKANPNSRTATAVFQVEYIGFSSQAQTAFQEAVNIWSTLIKSPVKIKIRAYWRPLGTNVLGSAIWGNAFANFPNAQKLNTFYPVALAEKMAGKDLNHPDSVDIFANFSSETAWYYGTSGNPPANTTDLVSVVLHEIGHGLGFTDSYDVESGLGSHGVQSTPIPIVYDLAVENGNNQNLFRTFTSPSGELATELTGSNIFYNSALAKAANNDQLPRLYAPATWNGGSSIAHLNESTYGKGDPNSLMTPFIGFTEVMHDPGQIVLGIFSDMGWVGTRIEHTPVNKESIGATTILAKINSDNGFDAAKVKLKYIKKSGGSEIEVVGTATANAGEFSFTIPASANNDSIYYYLSATDVINREFTTPGKFARSKNTELQGKFTIGLGADLTAPTITHTPKTFIAETATNLKIDAVVSDNFGVQTVMLDYWINNVQQTSVQMNQTGTISLISGSLLATYSSAYTITVPFANGAIKNGDVVSYRIRATDNSFSQNIGYSPTSTTKHTVSVVGLAATQNSYQNNFDNLSTADFFGDSQFSIIKPSGFTNGAIHSIHPYPEAGSGSLNFVYQLRIPIKVKAQDATVKFDEIVLVEPGEPNSTFGNADFYDYVVVEGSKNGGLTWTPIDAGYDSRDYDLWLTRYNSSIVSNISQGVGDPGLFRTRTLNLLNKFSAGDEVVIRFRLFSDPGAAGWGWAIDNLKIQIDETPPTLLHNHLNFTTDKSNPLNITVNATDFSGVKSLAVEYKFNSGALNTFSIPLSTGVNEYTFQLGISAASVGDDVQYRIRATDNLNNEAILPSTDFFHVPIISIGAPVTQYTSDFNTTNTDFVGNFFSVSTPAGFTNGAMNTVHPYPNGFGLNGSSDYIFMLKKPITVSASNSLILFNEVVVAEYAANTDYVIVEGSKNNGTTWESLVDKYTSNAYLEWKVAYDSKTNGTAFIYKPRYIDLVKGGKFVAGDVILIRFRLAANSTNNAWGWAIDNLSIQGPITGFEKTMLDNSFSIFPNPSKGNEIKVELASENSLPVRLQVFNSQGQSIQSDEIAPVDKLVRHAYNASEWTNGVYLLKAEVNGIIVTKKFIKSE